MFKANPLPTGNNGFQTNLANQPCPAMSANWQVDGDAPLPVMPANAQTYYTNGAGTGPGLKVLEVRVQVPVRRVRTVELLAPAEVGVRVVRRREVRRAPARRRRVLPLRLRVVSWR